MPVYRYRCEDCQHEFEELHAMDAEIPECPECDSEQVKRLIVTAPIISKGILAHAGDGKRASKEELQDKWREETPRLRRKLRDKYGDEIVNQVPTLNMNIGGEE